jgi:hypothetical protein
MPKFGKGHGNVSKIKDLLYMRFDASNWKLRFCSCSCWCKHFFFGHAIVVAVKMGLVEFSAPVATLLLI